MCLASLHKHNILHGDAKTRNFSHDPDNFRIIPHDFEDSRFNVPPDRLLNEMIDLLIEFQVRVERRAENPVLRSKIEEFKELIRNKLRSVSSDYRGYLDSLSELT